MNIKVEKYYRVEIPIDISCMVQNLLKKIPHEHLIGLGAIILMDELTNNKRSHGAAGLYWRKNGREEARIEIALSAIYKGMPKTFFYFPFVAKFMLASVLFHELGHHYQQHVHGITKKDEESFAEKYKKQMLKQAFSSWRFLLLPFSPLVHLIIQKGGTHYKE
jgi:hypothetical protein